MATTFKNAADIRQAVDQGQKVYWASLLYEVIKDSKGQYLIRCTSNNNCTGLTWQDNTTLNGKIEDFFIALKIGDKATINTAGLAQFKAETSHQGIELLQYQRLVIDSANEIGVIAAIGHDVIDIAYATATIPIPKYLVQVLPVEPAEPAEFFYQDLSGRGFTCKLSLQDIQEMEEEIDEEEYTLQDWAERAEVGEQWADNANRFTRIN